MSESVCVCQREGRERVCVCKKESVLEREREEMNNTG